MDQQQSADQAKKYLEDMLSFFGVNTDVDVVINDEYIELSIPSTDDNSILIGRSAETLRAFQYLIATMLRNSGAELTRVNLDIAGYKKQRADKLIEEARGWIEAVRSGGDSKVAHLNAADRRIVHQVVAEYPDIISTSEGEGRDRHLIISQASS